MAETVFEQEREKLLGALLARAPFDGFNEASLRAAAEDAGVDRAVLAASCPAGVRDLIDAWSAQADKAAAAALVGEEAQALRIREKASRAVMARIAFFRPHKEAARRATAFLALPFNAAHGGRLAWNAADAIWRAMGDASTDYNFYTKRAILAAVWTSTLARWLADDDPDERATREFLDARIENVMQFEKAKAQMRKAGVDPEGMFGWLAKVRYPKG